jgi:hypothetical protein
MFQAYCRGLVGDNPLAYLKKNGMQIYIYDFSHQALFKPSGLANDNGQQTGHK